VRAVAFAATCGLGLLALFLLHPILGGHRLPIGPDGPVYTWWTELAAREGLGVIPMRPGVPGAALALGALLGTEPVETLALLGPVLAVACGLAGAALLETALGPNARRAGAVVLMVGAFAGYLAAGWLANLALAVLFLGATAALALPSRSWRPVVAGAILLVAGGLSHVLFLVAGVGILAGVALTMLPEAIRAVRAGSAPWQTRAARVALGAAGGGAGTALGFGVLAGTPIRVVTSQDALLRRIGLPDVLGRWLRERLLVDGRRAIIPFAAAGWLAVTLRSRRQTAETAPAMKETRSGQSGPERSGPGFLVALCGWWAAITVIGVASFALTGRAPANRLLPFAFFVPLAAAAGFAWVVRDAGATRVRRTGAWIAALAIVAAGLYGWIDRPPYVSEEELAAARGAAQSVDHLPAGTPLVFVVDTLEDAAAFHAARYSNVIRMELPPERVRDLRIAVARPGDFLAGRPTTTGDLEHDRLSEVTVAETVALSGRGAVLVLQPFNEPGFAEAVGLGTFVAPDVVSLEGGRPVAAAAGAAAHRPGLGAGALIVLSVAALAILWLFGAGWARWALPGAGALAVTSAAASAGLAVAVLGAFVADGIGLPDGGGGGAGAAIVLGGLGYLAAARSRRH
jgi:hypothetical protein